MLVMLFFFVSVSVSVLGPFIDSFVRFVHSIDAIERKTAFFLPAFSLTLARILLTDKHLLRSQFSPFK